MFSLPKQTETVCTRDKPRQNHLRRWCTTFNPDWREIRWSSRPNLLQKCGPLIRLVTYDWSHTDVVVNQYKARGHQIDLKHRHAVLLLVLDLAFVWLNMICGTIQSNVKSGHHVSTHSFTPMTVVQFETCGCVDIWSRDLLWISPTRQQAQTVVSALCPSCGTEELLKFKNGGRI